MGRYRPPAPKASPYITREGYDRLSLETKALWKRRAEVTKAVTAAAAEGDRSENAEYIYRKKELRSIDFRIRYLQKRLPELKIVETVPDNLQQVFFAAWVKLEDEQANIVEYRLVGPDEHDFDKAYISIDSPMAKALLKKHLDDEIEVKLPKGTCRYTIMSIRY